MNPDRILIIQTAFPGDVILTLPLLQVLNKNYPGSKIDFLCIPATSTLLKNNKHINEVIIYDKRKTGSNDFQNLIKLLRSKKYDLIISPHRSFRSALISKLCGAKNTISFDSSSFSFLYDSKVKYRQDIHEIRRNLSLLQPLGITEENIIKPELFISKKEEEKISEFLSLDRIEENEKFICIAPGSVWFTKRFPEDKFIRVCDLLEDIATKIVMIGGETDRELAECIKKKSKNKNILNSAGRFTFTESAELIRRASVLITNDSAPLHLANSVGTKVIAIFGATVPAFGFYPYGKNDVVIEINGLKCRPCCDTRR